MKFDVDDIPEIPKERKELLEWVAYPFSSRSSQPRNQIRASCITGRFFTILSQPCVVLHIR